MRAPVECRAIGLPCHGGGKTAPEPSSPPVSAREKPCLVRAWFHTSHTEQEQFQLLPSVRLVAFALRCRKKGKGPCWVSAHLKQRRLWCRQSLLFHLLFPVLRRQANRQVHSPHCCSGCCSCGLDVSQPRVKENKSSQWKTNTKPLSSFGYILGLWVSVKNV